HQLTLPNGLKEPPHYHNWAITADVSSSKLNNMAVVMNFQKLKAMIDNIVAEFDNEVLNNVHYFQQNNPSAENVARYIFEKIEPKLSKGVRLENVRVVEEPGCSAKFSK
ncbi:MAG: 6-carboxytetrahydropterin synthase, partial [Planctomycetota bacterium]|nr:6-carboxytetrahydropterin synthase [Planctomycetota bacterium]